MSWETIQDYIESARLFLKDLGLDNLYRTEEGDALIAIFFIGALSSLGTLLWRMGRWWVKRYEQQQLKKDLLPYYSVADIKLATQYFVPTQFQNVPPSRHSELATSNKTVARQPLLNFFLDEAFRPDQNDQRFYMVLAGSGMGKTTFMLNLYLRYIQRKRFMRNGYEIYLLPLAASNLLKRIEQIESPEKTILLLDGLDEDTRAVRNYKVRLKDILETVQEFRTVVFTCRTQFFPSDEEVPKITHLKKFGGMQGFQSFDLLYIAPFNKRDINRYLNKRYSWYQFSTKRKAREIINYSPTLMVRPMVLSNIDDLMEAPVDYFFTVHLYEAMIGKWVERETIRVEHERQETFRNELYRFSEAIAQDMYEQRRHRKGLFIGEKDIRPFAEKHRIKLEEIELRSRSLLNRDAQGQYKFAHKSILEYFLAKIMVERPAFAAQFSFDGMDQARVFYHELSLNRTTLPLFKELRDSGAGKLPNGEWKNVDQFSPTEVKLLEALVLKKAKRIEAVSPLLRLKSLELDQTDIKELAPLEGLGLLEHLSLSQTNVEDLRPLGNLEKLQTLCLNGTQIRVLDHLNRLTRLRELRISHTAVSHLDATKGMDQLEILECSRTQIKDLNPLRRHYQLRELDAFRTPVGALSPLRELEGLEKLNLGRSKVKNISAIRGLTRLEYLNLDQLQLGDWSILKRLTGLRSFSARMSNFAHLEILKELPLLEELMLDQCPLENLAVIRDMQSLRALSLRKMPLPPVAVLEQLPKLQELRISRTQFSETEQKKLVAALPNLKVFTTDKPRKAEKAS